MDVVVEIREKRIVMRMKEKVLETTFAIVGFCIPVYRSIFRIALLTIVCGIYRHECDGS